MNFIIDLETANYTFFPLNDNYPAEFLDDIFWQDDLLPITPS